MTTRKNLHLGVMTASLVLLCSAALAATADTNQVEAKQAASTTDQNALAMSHEGGQTPLDESFGWAKRRERIREQRKAALTNTQFNAEFRTMYLDRNKFDGSESEAWAVGGSAGLKTGFFRDRIAFGLTGYTSQKVDGPDDKDGTLLLKPQQHSYTVLGEAYGELLVTDSLRVDAGRKGYDTPYINRNDVRMTPNTFEAITFQGKADIGDGGSSIGYGGGYFDQIKERNSDDFVSMSKDAGAKVDRGVYTGGGNFKNGDFSLGAIDYYSEDIINIAYAEAKHAISLNEKLKLKLAAQYSDQESTGDNLLQGKDFSADQFGLKAELPVGDATFTVAYTDTGDGDNMQNPWSGYPGYTSVQVQDFNRAGEAAVLLRAAYAFDSIVKGLSAYALWVNGTEPEASDQYKQDEYDFNLQWKAAEGALKGMMLRARYAVVTQDGGDVDDLTDLRLMCFYDVGQWL